MSIPAEPFLLQNVVQILNAKPRKWLTGSGSDNVLWLDTAALADHCPVILLQMLEVWLCQWPSLTAPLSDHCPVILLQMLEVNGQVSQGHGALPSAHKLYTRPCILKERWREKRTGSSSLNFFQAVFTHVVVESSQPLAAESMSLR